MPFQPVLTSFRSRYIYLLYNVPHYTYSSQSGCAFPDLKTTIYKFIKLYLCVIFRCCSIDKMLLQIKKYIFYLRAATIIIILSGSYCFVNDALAQGRLVTGKVTDAQTGEPVPYVTISVKLNNGTRRGTVTDFDGLYHIQVPQSIATDSIYCTYIGYIPSQKKLTSGANPKLTFNWLQTVKCLVR